MAAFHRIVFLALVLLSSWLPTFSFAYPATVTPAGLAVSSPYQSSCGNKGFSCTSVGGAYTSTTVRPSVMTGVD